MVDEKIRKSLQKGIGKKDSHDIILSRGISGMDAKEGSHKGIDRDAEIARSVIESPEYGRRLSRLGETSKVQQKIIDESKAILRHRNGTYYEDLAFINSMTGEVGRVTDYDKEREVMPSGAMKQMVEKSGDYTVISIHNHPGSTVPSDGDINSIVQHKHKYGLVVGHDGSIFKYSMVGAFNRAMYYAAWRGLYRNENQPDSMTDFIRAAAMAGVLVEVL